MVDRCFLESAPDTSLGALSSGPPVAGNPLVLLRSRGEVSRDGPCRLSFDSSLSLRLSCVEGQFPFQYQFAEDPRSGKEACHEVASSQALGLDLPDRLEFRDLLEGGGWSDSSSLTSSEEMNWTYGKC